MPNQAVAQSSIYSVLNPKYHLQVSIDGQTVEVALVKYAFTPLAEGQMGAKRDNPSKLVPAKTWNYWQTMPYRNGHHQAYTKANLPIPQYAAIVRDVDDYAGGKIVVWNGAFWATQEEVDARPVVTYLSGEKVNGVYRTGSVLSFDIETVQPDGTAVVTVAVVEPEEEDLPEVAPEVEVTAVYTGDPFTQDPVTGHFIGDDGFRVPRNFEEFCEWNPRYVENWTKRRLGRSADPMDVEDWTQDLNIHLGYLPQKSKHRLPGTNGRPEGCKDVIETFNPIRQYGASERRFRHYINSCLSNRFSTIQSKRQKNPICRAGNLTLASAVDPENLDVVDDEYIHQNSEFLSRQSRQRVRQNEQRVFLTEYTDFLAREDKDMLRVVVAIQSTQTFGEAQRDLGMTDQEFSRARNRLKQLAACFQEDQLVPKQRKPYKRRGE